MVLVKNLRKLGEERVLVVCKCRVRVYPLVRTLSERTLICGSFEATEMKTSTRFMHIFHLAPELLTVKST